MNENQEKYTAEAEQTDTSAAEQKIWGAAELDRELASDGAGSEHKHKPQPKYRKKRATRRGFPYFYVIYASLVAIAVISIFCVCNFVGVLLFEYEQVQPKYKADEIFSEHFREPDVAALMDFADKDFAEFESKEYVIARLTEQLESGEITYAETLKKEDGERIYSVYSDGKRFAFFSLVEGDRSTEHGFKFYELGQIEMQFSLPSSQYKFILPDRYTLYVNGIAVSDKYKTGETLPADAYRISGGKVGADYIEYSIGGILTTPTFEVKDECGADAQYYWVEEGQLYTADMASVTVRVPRGYIPYLEGSEIGVQYVNSDKEPVASAYNKFLAEGSQGLDYIEYSIGGFYSDEKPNISVKSADGYECGVYYVEKEALYECYPAYNTALKAEHEESIKEFFRNYTLYLQYVNVTADGEPTDYIKKSDLKPYFDTSSKTWRAFNSISVSWNYEPEKYEFTDESIDEFVTYPDGTFSCRVIQTYNSWRRNNKYTQHIDKIVFYKISDGKILIYEMTNTDAVSGIGQPITEG